jgi:hypothetical protein
MKDRKIRMKNRMQIKGVSKYIREHLDELIDNDTDMRLQTLDLIFSGSQRLCGRVSPNLRRAFAKVRPHLGTLSGDVSRRRAPPQLIQPGRLKRAAQDGWQSEMV